MVAITARREDMSACYRSRDLSLGTDLEPDEDEIPETDHGELRGRHAAPRVRIFDSDDVHGVYKRFHREECD